MTNETRKPTPVSLLEPATAVPEVAVEPESYPDFLPLARRLGLSFEVGTGS